MIGCEEPYSISESSEGSEDIKTVRTFNGVEICSGEKKMVATIGNGI